MEKFYYEKWFQLGKSALERGNDIADYFQKYLTSIIEVYDLVKQKYLGIIREGELPQIRIKFKEELGKEQITMTIYGIDSSQAGFHRIGGFLVVPLTASKIKLILKISEDEGIKITDNDYAIETDIPRDVHDGLSPEVAARKAHIAMLRMEVDVMNNIYNELINNYEEEELFKRPVFIFIDGPIIDPPDIRISIQEFDEYMSSRALAVKKLMSLGENIYVVGFVKRVMGCMFYKRLLEDFRNQIEIERKEFENDWTLSSILLKYHLIRNCLPYEKCIAYTRPLPLEDKNLKYFDEKGLLIYYSYVIFHFYDTIGPYRIDFVIPKIDLNRFNLLNKLEDTIKKIIFITYSTLVPGQKYPLPISLAHTLCSLPKKEARRIIRIVTSEILKELSKSESRASLTREFILTLLGSEGEI